MFRLKITLKPEETVSLRVNYKSTLQRLFNRVLLKGEQIQYRGQVGKKDKGNAYFSPLFCCDYEADDEKITFKDEVNWYITASSYDTIIQLVQGFFSMDKLRLGKSNMIVAGLEMNEVEVNEAKSKIKNMPMYKIENAHYYDDLEYSIS